MEPVTYSVSTWQQPVPPAAGPARAAVVRRVVEEIERVGEHRRRVAIDGYTAAGKTSFGHEVAVDLAGRGRPAFRASLDDFKRPWAEAHRYDRRSGEGYYRNAFDRDAARRLLLDPLGPSGDGNVALCSIDPITQVDHSSVTTSVPLNGVLVVDGTFAFRPELDDCWDLRIWLDIDPELSIRRGIDRDADAEGGVEAAEQLHRDRYLAAETIYLAEVDPVRRADVVIDNTTFAAPRLLRPLP